MKTYCLTHQNKHDYHSWRFTEEGWSCSDNIRYPEFVPQKMKDERVQYARDILQPYRGTDPSKEFMKAYPKQSKKMFTDKQRKSAKNVWLDIKGLGKYQD